MRCEEALELISAALDGELTARERGELDDHLASCPDCATLFDELAGQSRLLRELDCEVPADLTDRILSQLSEQQAGTVPSRPRRVLHWRRWGTLAACLVLAVWAGLSLPGTSSESASGPLADAYSIQDAVSSSALEFSQAEDEHPDVIAEAKFAETDSIAPQSSDRAAGVQYLRTTWTESTEPITAQYLSSSADLTGYLAQYPEDTAVLTLATECYDDAYFETAALIAVPLEESSSSITPTVAEVTAVDTGYQVVIQQETPEAATDGMASWLILIETEPATTATVTPDTAAGDTNEVSEPAPEEVIYVLVED